MTLLRIFRSLSNALILITSLLLLVTLLTTSTPTSTTTTAAKSKNPLSSSSLLSSAPTAAWTMVPPNPAHTPPLPKDAGDAQIIRNTTDDFPPLESATEGAVAGITNGSSWNMGGSKCTTIGSHDDFRVSVCGECLGSMRCRRVRVVFEVVRVLAGPEEKVERGSWDWCREIFFAFVKGMGVGMLVGYVVEGGFFLF